MGFNRFLWRGGYSQEDFPGSFVCPSCNSGRLVRKEESFQKMEAGYSTRLRESDDYWEPEYLTWSFAMLLVCDRIPCGEVVAVTGRVAAQQDYDERSHSVEYYDVLVPKSFFPAPRIISVPPNAPADVCKAIDMASLHYWADRGASANSLRASLEFLLDYLKAPRFDPLRGKRRLNLIQRIDQYALLPQSHADVEDHATSMNLLRDIGNVGSHGEPVERDVLLSLFELYEYTLEEIFGMRKEKARLLRESLKQRG